VKGGILFESGNRAGETLLCCILNHLAKSLISFHLFPSVVPFLLTWFVTYEVAELRRKFGTCLWVVLVQICWSFRWLKWECLPNWCYVSVSRAPCVFIVQ